MTTRSNWHGFDVVSRDREIDEKHNEALEKGIFDTVEYSKTSSEDKKDSQSLIWDELDVT
jgi:hypothetical protein